MSRFPKARRLITEEYFLKPFGDRTTDTTNLYNLITRLDANKQNVIRLGEGTHKWDGTVATSLVGYAGLQCNKPLFVRGHKGMGSVIEGSNGFTLNVGSFAHPFNTDNPATFSGITAGNNQFTAPSISLESGDWVVIWSDDNLTGLNPHLSIQRPAELHRIARVKDISGTDNYILSDPTLDAMTTRPKIEKVTLMRGCGVSDVRLRSADMAINTLHNAFIFRYCQSPRVERCFTEETGYGAVNFCYCADTQVNDFSGLKQGSNANDIYAVVGLVNNGFLFQDSIWHEARHTFTTGSISPTPTAWAAGQTILSANVYRSNADKLYRATGAGTTGATAPTHTSGTASDGGVTWQFETSLTGGNGIQWGTPINTVIRNVTAYSGTTDQDESLVLFDTHPAGNGVEFDRCRAYLGAYAGQVSYAFQTRSRNTKFLDCEVRGEANGTIYGFRSLATGTKVRGGYVKDCWYGAFADDHDGMSVRGAEFVNTVGNAFRIADADNHEFDSNIVTGGCAQASTDETFIKVVAGTGHKIMRNQLYKGTNTWSVSVDQAPSGAWRDHVDFRHNYVEGYTSGKIGSDTGTTPGASMETEYASHNFTDA